MKIDKIVYYTIQNYLKSEPHCVLCSTDPVRHGRPERDHGQEGPRGRHGLGPVRGRCRRRGDELEEPDRDGAEEVAAQQAAQGADDC